MIKKIKDKLSFKKQFSFSGRHEFLLTHIQGLDHLFKSKLSFNLVQVSPDSFSITPNMNIGTIQFGGNIQHEQLSLNLTIQKKDVDQFELIFSSPPPITIYFLHAVMLFMTITVFLSAPWFIGIIVLVFWVIAHFLFSSLIYGQIETLFRDFKKFLYLSMKAR